MVLSLGGVGGGYILPFVVDGVLTFVKPVPYTAVEPLLSVSKYL